MDIFKRFGCCLLAVCLGTASANASIVSESFSFTGANYTATGLFAYDSVSNAVVGISGNVIATSAAAAGTGGAIGQLITSGTPFYPTGNPADGVAYLFYPSYPGNGFTYDNLFDPVTQTFSSYGVLFSFGSGNFGSFYFGPTAFFSTYLPDGVGTAPDYSDYGPLYAPGDAGVLNIQAVPEMSTWLMMIFGFLAIAMFGRFAAGSRPGTSQQRCEFRSQLPAMGL